MISKLHAQWLIKNQKVAARKSIAALEMKLPVCDMTEWYSLVKLIASERAFLGTSLKYADDTESIIKIVHATRHFDLSNKSDHTNCLRCKEVMAEMAIEMPGAPAEQEYSPETTNNEDDMKPRFGNLMAVLEQEVADEKANVEGDFAPSQNDITRWALKDAVLAFYQGLNLPENTVIVDTLYDDRLTHQLAPDFDVIAKGWMEKLDELQRRNDKYVLEIEEYDRAEADLSDGMRGSAFEKQLDRYREEFMKKLKR